MCISKKCFILQDGMEKPSDCPCSMALTKEDYSKISRGMPPRMATHILTKCLGISNVWNAAEFEAHRYKCLMTWSNDQTNEVTRAIMYDKLLKAVHLELCESPEWFDFLIPQECKNHHSSDKDIAHTCTNADCPCNMKVTEQEFSKISRGMPPRMWKHICRECLGISDNDLHKAEYKNMFKFLESSIFDALITWSHAQKVRVTKARLYRKFVIARNMGLCESSEWFEFFIPQECQKHIPSPVTEIIRPQGGKIGILEECMVRRLPTPIQIHVMLTSFIVKLLYGKSLTFLWGCLFVTFFCPLLTFLSVRGSSIVLHTKSKAKLGIVYLLSLVFHFIALIVAEGHMMSYFVNIYIIQLILLLINAENTSTFRFLTKRQITAVYGMYRPKRFFYEIELSFINWSVLGMMAAFCVRLKANPSTTSVFYISCFTTVINMIVWASTLDQDSCQCITYKVQCQRKTCCCFCRGLCATIATIVCIFPFIIISGVICFALLTESSLPKEPLPSIMYENNDLVIACISTLVILNVVRICNFCPEENRRPVREYLSFFMLHVINTCVLHYRLSKCDFKTDFETSFDQVVHNVIKVWYQIFFPFNGYSPYDLYLCSGLEVNRTAVPTEVPLNIQVTNITVTEEVDHN